MTAVEGAGGGIRPPPPRAIDAIAIAKRDDEVAIGIIMEQLSSREYRIVTIFNLNNKLVDTTTGSTEKLFIGILSEHDVSELPIEFVTEKWVARN